METKKKRKQRLAGGSKNTNTNVNNAGNVGVQKNPALSSTSSTLGNPTSSSENTIGRALSEQGGLALDEIASNFSSGEGVLQGIGNSASTIGRRVKEGLLGISRPIEVALEGEANVLSRENRSNLSQSSPALTDSISIRPIGTPQSQPNINIQDTISRNDPTEIRSGRLGGSVTNPESNGSFNVLDSNPDGTVNVNINGSSGSVSANVAKSLGRGRGSFNTISSENLSSGNRLQRARLAVSKLKDSGASASAQLKAFRSITNPNPSLESRFISEANESLDEGDESGSGFFSRQALRIRDQASSERANQASSLKNRLGSSLASSKSERQKQKDDLDFNVKANSSVLELSKKDPNNPTVSLHSNATKSNNLSTIFKDKKIPLSALNSVFENLFVPGESLDATLSRFQEDRTISDNIKLQLRDRIVELQSRR